MSTLKPRKPLMAAVMSLILPGFGQFYNGEVNRGLLLFIGFTLCSIPLVVLIALWLPSALTLVMLVLATLISLGLWIYGVVNAWKTARTLSAYTLKPWQTSGAYLLIFLSAMMFILPSMTQYARKNLVESLRVPSRSMEPSVMQGDIFFANKLYNCPQCPSALKRGDIGIFVYPNDRTLYYVKRIIAVAGDTVEMKQREIFVNGASLSQVAIDKNGHANTGAELFAAKKVGEVGQQDKVIVTEKQGDAEYQVLWLTTDNTVMDEFTVPSGQVFVLGDNRSASNDSRQFGMVPMRDVVGKAEQIWYSRGDEGIRWDRLGMLLK